MKSFNKFLYFQFILVFTFTISKSSAQEYQIQLLNKSPLYATASILQDYENDGDLDIILTRRNSTNDKMPSSVEWLENDGSGQFPRHTLFEGLSFPVDLDLGDFDDDGNMDYIISDRYVSINSGLLLLFQKQNDGSYLKIIIEDSIRTDQASVGDFDGDGNLDVVAVGFNRPAVSIYWNDGNLNFSKQEITESVVQVELVEVNDIDDDGDEDIVYGGGGLEGLKILYNDGKGMFDSTKTLFMNNNQYSNSKRGLTIADLNNDGIKDILTFSGVGFGGLYYFDGSNDFTSSLIDIVGIDLGGDIVVADFDMNGLNDIIRQNMGDNYLSIHYQESELVFSTEYLEKNWDNRGPGQMSVGDLDGDNDLDLVFPENGNVDGDISWFENIDGSLYRHYLYSEIEAVGIPIIGDLDNDGDLDIVVTAGDDGPKSEEDEITWYENKGGNKFIENRVDDDISAPSDIKLGDLDGDGFKDIVATSYEDSNLVWYKNNGSSWTKSLVDETLVNPLGCDILDLDMDGDLDIALCSYGENKIIWYKNNGLRIFSRHEIDDAIIGPRSIRSVDLNNDNETDLAVVSSDSSNTVTVYINDGNENFTRSVILMNQLSYTLDIGDWDNNGTTDIIVGFDKGSSLGDEIRDVSVLLNNGDATFIDSTLVVHQERTDVLKLADVDNDSDLDILFGSGSSGIFPLRLAINENGTVKSIKEITDRAVRVYGIDAADINEDGIIDVVASDQVNSTNNLLLFLGTMKTDINSDMKFTPNTFSLHQNYPNPFNPSTNINFDIGNTSKVSLIIFDILGRKVKTLVNEIKQKGSYHIQWNGKNESGTILPSGIYIMQLNAGGVQISKSMLLLK